MVADEDQPHLRISPRSPPVSTRVQAANFSQSGIRPKDRRSPS
jgi:hypothetical protein